MALIIPAGLVILATILMAVYGLFTIIEPLKIASALAVGLWLYVILPNYTKSHDAMILVAVIGGVIAYNIFIGMMWLVPFVILVMVAPQILENWNMLTSLMKGKKRK